MAQAFDIAAFFQTIQQTQDSASGFHIYYGTALRLILLPALTFIFLKSIGVTGYLLGVNCVATAMPAAANSVMLAEKFNADAALASRMVFLSTALSIITIPLMTIFL